MAKTASDKPAASAEEALKQRKKQARREAKLMLKIEAANKELKKAQEKQAKALARLEAQRSSLQALEARLAQLRAQSLEPESETPPPGGELEHQEEPSALKPGMLRSDGQPSAPPGQAEQDEITSLTDQAMALLHAEGGMDKAFASPEGGASTPTDEEPAHPAVQ